MEQGGMAPDMEMTIDEAAAYPGGPTCFTRSPKSRYIDRNLTPCFVRNGSATYGRLLVG
jgi:hypothetical protein